MLRAGACRESSPAARMETPGTKTTGRSPAVGGAWGAPWTGAFGSTGAPTAPTAGCGAPSGAPAVAGSSRPSSSSRSSASSSSSSGRGGATGRRKEVGRPAALAAALVVGLEAEAACGALPATSSVSTREPEGDEREVHAGSFQQGEHGIGGRATLEAHRDELARRGPFVDHLHPDLAGEPVEHLGERCCASRELDARRSAGCSGQHAHRHLRRSRRGQDRREQQRSRESHLFSVRPSSSEG